MTRGGAIALAGVLSLMVTGCQTGSNGGPKTISGPPYRQNLEEKYVPISIRLNGGARGDLADLFLAELRATAMFTDVGDHRSDTPVVLEVLFMKTEKDSSTATGVAKGVVSGASLGVIPMRYEHAYALSVSVVVRGSEIRHYQFAREASSTLFLLSDPQAKEREVCRALIAALLAAMQADELFEKRVPALLEAR